MKLKLKALADQVVVITGANSGIGLVTAKAAASRGAKVLLVARGEEALAAAVQEIRQAGGTADYAVADVGVPSEVEGAAARAVERFGRIDSWINNAGVAIYARLVETPLLEHDRLFRTNYFGVVNGTMAALAHLRQGGGALITVGSIASDIPAPAMGAYSASKHAVKAFVETLRIEIEEEEAPISVTLIKPAGIDTPIGQHAFNPTGRGEAQIPPPVYDPDLVADAILHAAEHPRRDITVGGAGRAQVLLGTHFPGLLELAAPAQEKLLFERGTPQPRPSNLFVSRNAGRERSGEHSPRRVSLYTTAQLHPNVAAALGLMAAVAGAAVLGWRSRRRG